MHHENQQLGHQFSRFFFKNHSLNTAIQWMIVLMIVLGVFFRCFNLDHKVYWYDEALTSQRNSGYSQIEIVEQWSSGLPIESSALKKYQSVNPDRSVARTLELLALESPQHSPLYFASVRIWGQWFGTSIAAIRSFSVLVSLLSLPCIYWLSLELFKTPLAAGFSTALFSISPFQFIYAQEARPYALLNLAIIVSCTIFLKALQTNNLRWWITYAVTLSFGLYSHPFFVPVLLAQGAVIICLSLKTGIGKVINFFLCFLAACLAYSPWIWIWLVNAQATGKSHHLMSGSKSYGYLLRNWVANISRNFIDFGFDFAHTKFSEWLPFLPFLFAVLILVAFAYYLLWRYAEFEAALLISLLAIIPALPLIARDLILGGQILENHSVVGRYMMPCYLSINFAVAYLFSLKITNGSSSKFRYQRFWRSLFALVATVGVISLIISSQATHWHHQTTSSQSIDIAKIVNAKASPLLIVDLNNKAQAGQLAPQNSVVGDVLSLSHYLNDNVQLVFLLTPPSLDQLREYKKVFKDMFLYGRPTPEFLEGLESTPELEIIPAFFDTRYRQYWLLWQLALP